MRILILLLLAGCSQQEPACDPAYVDALGKAYTVSARKLIASGACDKHDRVEDCLPYRVLEEHQDLALRGIGCH